MWRSIQLFQVVLTLIILSNYCYSQNIAKPKIGYITKFDSTFKEERNVGIKFVNSRGIVTKTMSLNNNIVSNTKDYVIHRRHLKNPPNSCYYYRSINLLNALGKTKWQKTIRSYTTMNAPDDPYDYHQNEGLANTGGIYFVQYRDSTEKFYIDIIDTTGSYLMQIKHDHPFGDIEIAGDGKLLVARTGYYEYADVYFVFDITTQRSQIIRGSIEYQNTSFTISPRNNKELNIFGDIYEFDKLPIGYFPFRMGK